MVTSRTIRVVPGIKKLEGHIFRDVIRGTPIEWIGHETPNDDNPVRPYRYITLHRVAKKPATISDVKKFYADMPNLLEAAIRDADLRAAEMASVKSISRRAD